nr:MAG TPA: hypothetical protein [Caudoviricetes sp.]
MQTLDFQYKYSFKENNNLQVNLFSPKIHYPIGTTLRFLLTAIDCLKTQ